MNNKVFEKFASIKRDTKKAEEVKNWLESKKLGVKLASTGLAAAAIITGATACQKQNNKPTEPARPGIIDIDNPTTTQNTPTKPEVITPEIVIAEFDKLVKEIKSLSNYANPDEYSFVELNSDGYSFTGNYIPQHEWLDEQNIINEANLINLVDNEDNFTQFVISNKDFDALMKSFNISKTIMTEKMIPEDAGMLEFYYQEHLGEECYLPFQLTKEDILKLDENQLNILYDTILSIQKLNFDQNKTLENSELEK